MTASPFAPHHLRGLVEREERAERDLRGARAQALIDLVDRDDFGGESTDPLDAAYYTARRGVLEDRSGIHEAS